jgi:hypothetical protein
MIVALQHLSIFIPIPPYNSFYAALQHKQPDWVADADATNHLRKLK